MKITKRFTQKCYGYKFVGIKMVCAMHINYLLFNVNAKELWELYNDSESLKEINFNNAKFSDFVKGCKKGKNEITFVYFSELKTSAEIINILLNK